MCAVQRPWRKWIPLEVDLPLLWIAAEPLLTLFSRELKNIDTGQGWTARLDRHKRLEETWTRRLTNLPIPKESICRLWDFFLIEGPCLLALQFASIFSVGCHCPTGYPVVMATCLSQGAPFAAAWPNFVWVSGEALKGPRCT